MGSMNARSWVMLVILSVLWGGSFFLVGIAVKDLQPLTITTFRVGIAAVILWAIVFMLGLRPPKQLKIWLAFMAMGLLNNALPFTLITWGQTQIASGLAAIISASTPVFTVMVAGWFLPDEPPTPLKLAGVVIGFAGVFTMIGIPAMSGYGSTLAQLAVVVASACYAFAGIYGRRFKRMGIHPIVTAAGQVTAATLVLMPVTWVAEGPVTISGIGTDTWAAISGLAVFSTAFAYILYFRILEQAGATNVLLVNQLAPVSAVLLGSVFLDESLELLHFVGMLMIVLGLSVIDGRIWYRIKSNFY